MGAGKNGRDHAWKGCGRETYELKSVFTQLLSEQQSAEHSKPHTPTQHLLHLLDVHNSKDKDELVEDKVPELVSHVLFFDSLQVTKHNGVDELGQEEETATEHVQNSLWHEEIFRN